MVRIFNVYFPGRTLLLAFSEALLIVLALFAAIFAVFGGDAGLALNYEYGFIKVFLAASICMLCMHYYDLYDSMVLYSPGQMATRIVQVLGTVCLILGFVYYVYPVVRLNRDLLFIWVFLAGIVLIVWRKLFLAFNRSSRLIQKSLLLGAGPLARVLAWEIESRPELGLNLVGYIDEEAATKGEFDNLPYLGGMDALPDLLQRQRIQRVIVTMGNRRGRLPVESLLEAKAHGVMVEDGSRLYEAVAGRVDLSGLRPSTLLLSDPLRLTPMMLVFKRAASIAFSSIGLLLSLPVMALIAIAIKLDSHGPVIFRQKRVGKDGKPFILYKFRSMREGADADGKSKPAQHNDDRITRVGQCLRRTRLDELPQLFNILRGDMYFIGPRPFAIDMEKDLERQIPFYSNRWAVKPGATGWAQVRRGYNATLEDNIEKLSFDLYYIKHFSVGLDFLILFETIKILLLSRGGR